MSLKTKTAFVIISVACCLAFGSIAVQAQEAAAETKPAANRLQLEKADFDTKGPVTKGFTLTQRRVKRLPNFYRDVVSETQRDKIYEIQDEYYPYITMLNERIQQLREEQDEKIKAVLSQNQVTQIEKLTEESRSRRAANAAVRPEE